MTEDEPDSLSRPQRRLLRRLYNGRTSPVVADGLPFLTYKAAAKHLLSLQGDDRERVYAQMKAFAKTTGAPPGE